MTEAAAPKKKHRTPTERAALAAAALEARELALEATIEDSLVRDSGSQGRRGLRARKRVRRMGRGFRVLLRGTMSVRRVREGSLILGLSCGRMSFFKNIGFALPRVRLSPALARLALCVCVT